jgi:hypothetical protein
MTQLEEQLAEALALLHRMRDCEAVKQVLVVYARALDERNWELLKSCFTPDAVIEGSIDTLKIDLALARTQRLAVQYARTMHYLTNHNVTVTGDCATSNCYVFAGHWKGDPPGTPHPDDLFGGVEYADELKRIDGRWYIDYRRVVAGWRLGPQPHEMRRPAQ